MTQPYDVLGQPEPPIQRVQQSLKAPYPWVNRVCWTALVLIIGLQYLLFRQYITREVSWAHAPAYDQLAYLSQIYSGYEQMLSGGFWNGLTSILKLHVANGMMLPAQATVLLIITGGNRLGALTLGFLYVMLAQVVLVRTVKWLTGGWSASFIALALFLMSNDRFYWAGGLDDFRIDLIASCLYGITICLIVRSGLYQSLFFSVTSGFSCALLILFRFLTTTYLSLLLVTTVIFLVLYYLRRRQKAVVWIRMRNVTIAMLTTSILCLPFLLYNARQIYDYYIRAGLGAEAQLRAAQAGDTSLYIHLLYYPKSLVQDHLGTTFLWCALIVVVTFACFHAFSIVTKSKYPGEQYRLFPVQEEAVPFLVFIGLAILSPFLCLTIWELRSPLVVGVLVIPATLLVVATAHLLFGIHRRWRWGARSTAGILMCAGVFTLFAQNSRHSTEGKFRGDEERLLKMYGDMADYAAAVGWKEPKIAIDRLTDYLNVPQFEVLTYEKKGLWIPATASLGANMFGGNKADMIRAFQDSDFAIITDTFPQDGNPSDFPFDRQMLALRPDFVSIAASKLVLLQRINYRGHEFSLYAKPSILVEGTSGPWMTSSGARISVPCRILQSRPVVMIAGSTMFIDQLHGSLGVEAHLDQGEDQRPVPAAAALTKDRYSIRLDLHGMQERAEGFCAISLAFDRYFVPKDIGLNADTRRLVIYAPTDFSFDK